MPGVLSFSAVCDRGTMIMKKEKLIGSDLSLIVNISISFFSLKNPWLYLYHLDLYVETFWYWDSHDES